MKNINELNITINKAIVEKVTLSLGKNGLEVDIEGGLYTPQNRKISSFDFSTHAWSEDNKIKVPAYINSPAKEIFEQLTPIVYKQINGLFPELKSGLEG